MNLRLPTGLADPNTNIATNKHSHEPDVRMPAAVMPLSIRVEPCSSIDSRFPRLSSRSAARWLGREGEFDHRGSLMLLLKITSFLFLNILKEIFLLGVFFHAGARVVVLVENLRAVLHRDMLKLVFGVVLHLPRGIGGHVAVVVVLEICRADLGDGVRPGREILVGDVSEGCAVLQHIALDIVG